MYRPSYNEIVSGYNFNHWSPVTAPVDRSNVGLYGAGQDFVNTLVRGVADFSGVNINIQQPVTVGPKCWYGIAAAQPIIGDERRFSHHSMSIFSTCDTGDIHAVPFCGILRDTPPWYDGWNDVSIASILPHTHLRTGAQVINSSFVGTLRPDREFDQAEHISHLVVGFFFYNFNIAAKSVYTTRFSCEFNRFATPDSNIMLAGF